MQDKQNSNVVVTKKENRTSSHAQELSRLKTAKATTVTGTNLSANSPKRDNSQMSKPVRQSAKISQISGRNATLQTKNVRIAHRALQAATPRLTVKPHATSPMPNAMTPLENAKSAIKARMPTALRLNQYATLAARSLTTLRLFATRPQVNAKNATQHTVDQDVFQLLHAKKDAKRTTLQLTNNLNASGKLTHQNARNLMLVHILRNNAMICARTNHLPNVISRTTNALVAKLVKTLSACTLPTTARLCKKEENVNHNPYKDSTE